MNTNIVDVVIPLYNKLVKDVPVVSAAIQSSVNCNIHICDNSEDKEIKESNVSFCNELLIEYHDMGGNAGLSKAYNRAVDSCRSSIICIFDDDTQVNSSYFQILVKQIEIHGSGVYIPLVYNRDSLMSPLDSLGPAIFRYRNLNSFNPETCYAINTGMAITRDIFDLVRYDESLFIEWVDHSFCQSAHNAGVRFHLLTDIKLEQNYSRETNSVEAALHRERLAASDLRVYYSGSMMYRIYGFVYRCYRVIKCCIKYNTLSFLRIF